MRIIPSKKILSYAHPLLLTGVFLFTVPFAHAEVTPYIPLVGLPGLPVEGAKSIPEYINQVYLLVIGVGALAGVLRIAWAGVKYSLSDVVTEKSEAKHDITGVLMGLAILLVPFAVLSTINPDLVNLNVLQKVEKLDVSKSAQLQEAQNATMQDQVKTEGEVDIEGFRYNGSVQAKEAFTAKCIAKGGRIPSDATGDNGVTLFCRTPKATP